MKITPVKRETTSFFSATSNTLSYHQEALGKFINRPFSLGNFKNQIEEKNKNYNTKYRKIVRDVLIEQYANLTESIAVQENIVALENSDTFTVTTGHQLNLYTGPIFFIYKIIHTIKLARKLKQTYPNYNVVPVFWMASEDHDFDEINHFNLFGKKMEWSSDQKGAVGKFDLDGFDLLKEEIGEKFENQAAFKDYLLDFYKTRENLSFATRKLVHDLFGDKGLVIIDADHYKLKELFRPVLFKEITEEFSHKAVVARTKEIVALNYKAQVNPREINLFFLEDGDRTRIVKNADGSYKLGKLNCTSVELLELMDSKPELFSPNVILRPVYQEWILPNLAYVGGGGEMAYWLQFKSVFDALDLTFPIIQVRNSVQLIDKGSAKKMVKLNLSLQDIFKPIEDLKKEYVAKNSDDELNTSKLESFTAELAKEIELSSLKVDKGLDGYAKGEIAKLNKQIESFKSKLTRQQKKKFEEGLNQIDSLFKKIFPNGGLQERSENVIQYLAQHGKTEFIDKMFDVIDPMKNDLFVVEEL